MLCFVASASGCTVGVVPRKHATLRNGADVIAARTCRVCGCVGSTFYGGGRWVLERTLNGGLDAWSRASRREKKNADVRMDLTGGILGVGPLEVAVVFAVGWVVLGPTELVNVARQVGKFIGGLKGTFENVRTNVTQLVESENIMQTFTDTLRTVQEPIQEIQKESLSFQEQIMRMNDPKQVAPSEKEGAGASASAGAATKSSVAVANGSIDTKNGNGKVPDVVNTHSVVDAGADSIDQPRAAASMTSTPPPPKSVLSDKDDAHVISNRHEDASSDKMSPEPRDEEEEDLALSEELDLDELERRYKLRKRKIIAEAAKAARSTDSA